MPYVDKFRVFRKKGHRGVPYLDNIIWISEIFCQDKAPGVVLEANLVKLENFLMGEKKTLYSTELK